MKRALDLFCGAGGATKGLQRAGFHVTGVDIKPQPRYCGDDFVQSNALAMDHRKIGRSYDFVWASPVCKRFSRMSIVRAGLAMKHPDQIDDVRRLLEATGLPYVIENVDGAPLIRPQTLCGQMFGLNVIRHRLFESNVYFLVPAEPRHKPGHLCVVGHGGPANQLRWKVAEAREAMGIDWMTRDEIVEAIPPAYSEFIGRQIIDQL